MMQKFPIPLLQPTLTANYSTTANSEANRLVMQLTAEGSLQSQFMLVIYYHLIQMCAWDVFQKKKKKERKWKEIKKQEILIFDKPRRWFIKNGHPSEELY